MFKKNLALIKKLYKDRNSIKHQLNRVLTSDDLLILSVKNNQVDVAGHTSSAAMNVYLLGVGTAMAYASAVKESPDITVHEFLTQPTQVALGQLTTMGYLVENNVVVGD